MSLCPGCGISYCLDCEKSVDPRVYRCEPCRVEHDARDPFAITAQENHERAEAWKRVATASRACLFYMSGDQRDKATGDLVAKEYNEAWKAAEEAEKVGP